MEKLNRDVRLRPEALCAGPQVRFCANVRFQPAGAVQITDDADAGDICELIHDWLSGPVSHSWVLL